ncbi:hypothetical protein NKH93_33990 [Mesorhizobium sp. M0954]|uniref:hypothetical protein n=1 Tax=Mesorhizobium sp. M0954 TaxID=2957032 RepID=UPI0033351691
MAAGSGWQQVQLIFGAWDAIVGGIGQRSDLPLIMFGGRLCLPICSCKNPLLNRMRLHSVAERIAFFITLLVVFMLALVPVSRLKELGLEVGFHYDKLNHGIAFAVLMFVGGLAWPERKTTLIVSLALIGAAIEFLQRTSVIRRDLDVLDLAADCIGIATGLVTLSCASLLARQAA